MVAGAHGHPFIAVHDYQRIWTRGTEFRRIDVATGLRLCSWPDYMTLRDTADSTYYVVRRVRAQGQKAEHQRLESGYRWLLPTHNGHLRRAYAPARYVVSDKSVYTHTVYHVTRDGVRALCGWQFNGAAVLHSPPEGVRECKNCYGSHWRLVP